LLGFSTTQWNCCTWTFDTQLHLGDKWVIESLELELRPLWERKYTPQRHSGAMTAGVGGSGGTSGNGAGKEGDGSTSE
jgi:hypothetical protein